MKTRNIPVLLMALIFFIATPGYAEELGGSASVVTGDSAISATGEDFNPQGYYTFRTDPRLCPSPLCGVFFVKAVNRKLTRCANGSFKETCYIAAINNPQNIDLTSAALLQGRIKPKVYPGFGNLGVFELQAVFSSATADAGKGIFVGLENNGIVCITTPCFSIDQSLLDSCKSRVISGVDLTGFGASDEDIQKALAIVADSGALIAAGADKQVKETAGLGVTFVASQVYFPIAAIVKK